MSDLKPCPFCGGNAKIVDHRTDWFVQCRTCNVIVYGETVNHLDHIEDDKEAQDAFDAVDWDSLKQTAIDKWNARAKDARIAELEKALHTVNCCYTLSSEKNPFYGEFNKLLEKDGE